jgi:hypothetical protein
MLTNFVAFFILSEIVATGIAVYFLWPHRRENQVAHFLGVFLTAIFLDGLCRVAALEYRPHGVHFSDSYVFWYYLGSSLKSGGLWSVVLYLLKDHRVQQK